MQHPRARIVDTFYLIGTALLVCLFGCAAFLLADIYHLNPLWVFFGLGLLDCLPEPERTTETSFDRCESSHLFADGP
jgi:hypothetical protein